MSIYRYFDRDGTVIRVEPCIGAIDEAYIDMRHETSSYNNIAFIPKDEAPAVALAILEASGWDQKDTDEIASEAVAVLRNAAVAQQKAKARAEDEAKLDAEALALRNASLGVDADTLVGAHQDHWRRIALKARELYASKDAA